MGGQYPEGWGVHPWTSTVASYEILSRGIDWCIALSGPVDGCLNPAWPPMQ